MNNLENSQQQSAFPSVTPYKQPVGRIAHPGTLLEGNSHCLTFAWKKFPSAILQHLSINRKMTGQVQDHGNPSICINALWVRTSNKRPMGHIAHLRNKFKSVNTSEQSYDHIIRLIRRGKTHYLKILNQNLMVFISKTLSPLHPRMLCAKLG